VSGGADRDGRMREAFASLGETAPPGDGCPTPEQIWDAATGETSSQELVHTLIEHTASCPACAEDWRLARGLRSVSQESSIASPRTRHRANRLRWLVAAAAFVLLFATALPLHRWLTRPDRPAVRGTFGEIFSLVAEGERLPRERCLLRWSPGPPGTSFRLRVLTDDARELVAVDGVDQPEYLIEEESLLALPSGARLLWRVEATLPEGRHLVSPTFMNFIE